MKPARFAYARPDTLPAALELLGEHGSDAAVLSGGQSLMPMLNARLASPAMLVDINRIPGLDRIDVREDTIELGCLVRHGQALRSETLAGSVPLLPMALQHVAHRAIRNRGSLGGSLALADPAAELPACAVCLGATLRVVSRRGERLIAADAFFEDVYTTARADDELLVSVSVPAHGPGWRFAFEEVARRHGDFAIAALAFAARIEGSRIAACRIVFAGIEPMPRRMAGAEACLVGEDLGGSAARDAAAGALARELAPMASPDYPADYKIHLAGILLARALDRVSRERGP